MIWYKPKITFTNNIKGVAEVAPIIPASKINRKWVINALDNFKKNRQHPEYGMFQLTHTARCPGIFKFMRHGWVMSTWQDITIETDGTGSGFKWTTPINQKDIVGTDYVDVHPSHQYADFFDEWRNDTLRDVIKINSGWTCKVPRGYYLVEMPVIHSDETRFTTIPGVFFKEQGPAQMNPQLLWNVIKGKELIKAGTPIAQYMLVEKNNIKFKVEGVSVSDQDLFFVNNNRRFVKNYNEIKKFYSQN